MTRGKCQVEISQELKYKIFASRTLHKPDRAGHISLTRCPWLESGGDPEAKWGDCSISRLKTRGCGDGFPAIAWTVPASAGSACFQRAGL